MVLPKLGLLAVHPLFLFSGLSFALVLPRLSQRENIQQIVAVLNVYTNL